MDEELSYLRFISVSASAVQPGWDGTAPLMRAVIPHGVHDRGCSSDLIWQFSREGGKIRMRGTDLRGSAVGLERAGTRTTDSIAGVYYGFKQRLECTILMARGLSTLVVDIVEFELSIEENKSIIEHTNKSCGLQGPLL